MNISFQNIDKVSGLLTVKIEKADYQEGMNKSFKSLRQEAQMPGFRKGKIPMTLIQKMYRKSVIAEEVNKLISEKIYEYIKENNINILGDPLPNEDQIDFDTMEDFEFTFDIALSPEITIELTSKDKADYYTVEVTDEMVENAIKAYTQRNGKYEKVDAYQDKDMLKGFLIELDESGSAKTDGVQVEGAVLMPAYIKNEVQKAKFENVKVNDVLVFNPYAAYEGHDAEIASLLRIDKAEVENTKVDFSFQVEEITRFVEGDLNQELFDLVLGADVVKTEEEFRAKIRENLIHQHAVDSDYKFLLDMRKMLLKKTGKLEFSEKLLKRIMLLKSTDKNEELVNENYEKSIEELTWHLVKEKLVKDFEIKVEEQDIIDTAKSLAKAQFAQYGMTLLPDDMLNNYVDRMLSNREDVNRLVNRSIEIKLTSCLKDKVKLNNKIVPLEEFETLFD